MAYASLDSNCPSSDTSTNSSIVRHNTLLHPAKIQSQNNNETVSQNSMNFLSIHGSSMNFNYNYCGPTGGQLNENESFKLIEKAQPKKSRTKYSKEQIEILETAYWSNPYPDLITVEHLCKSLGINREKINIWYQNRRARQKRNVNGNSNVSNVCF